MTGEMALWAMLTGLITGGVWVGIVLRGQQRRLSEGQHALQRELDRRMDALVAVEERLADIEERLDFSERLLAQERDAKRLPPADQG